MKRQTARIYTRRPLLDRILERIEVADCWVFTGSKRRGGYGAIVRGGRNGELLSVHRALWELLVGPIPAGLELDHLCKNPPCCNPDHLEPVTRLVNLSRGRFGAGRPRREVCIRGHAFTVENTVIKSGCRTCRTCVNAGKRAYVQRRRERIAA